jgi:hypothetical protein
MNPRNTNEYDRKRFYSSSQQLIGHEDHNVETHFVDFFFPG